MQTKVYQGYEYTQGPDGKWHRGRPVAGGQSIQTKPADPKLPYEIRGLQNDVTFDEATMGARRREAIANADKAEIDVQSARQTLEKGPPKSATEIEADLKADSAGKRAATIRAIMGDVRSLYGKDIKGQPATRLFGAAEYIDSIPANDRFRSAGMAILPLIRPLVAQTAKEGDSDKEMDVFLSYVPSNDDSDASIEQKFRMLEMLIGGMVDGKAPSAVLAAPQQPTATRQTIADDPDRAVAVAQPGQRFATERDQRFNALVQSMLVGGASVEEANAAAAKYGYPGANGAPVFDPAQWAEAQAYNASRPRGAPAATVELPETGVSDPTILNRIAGSPAGALAGGYLNGVSAGFLDEGAGAAESFFTGRPMDEAIAEANLKKQISADAHPAANFTGNLLGGATTAFGGASLLGRAAPNVAKFINGRRALSPGAMGYDAGYGAVYGAGENNDDRLGGAGTGAVSGLVGGAAGRGTFNALGGAAAGARNAAQDALLTRKVRLTPGAMMGGRAKAVEDRFASIPVLGDLIASRQSESLGDFNRAAFGEFSEEVTDIGADGIRQARGQVNRLYNDALDGVNIEPSPQFRADVAAAKEAGAAVPGLGSQFDHLSQTKLDPLIDTPNLSGGQIQDALRLIRNRKSSYSKLDSSGANPMAADIVEALEKVETALLSEAERGAPGVGSKLALANRKYGEKKVLEDAVLRAEAQGGQFTPYQLGKASDANTRRFGGKAASAEGNRPFFELSSAGQEVLPSTVPNSGTADRALMAAALPAALGGASAGMGWIDPETALLIGSMGLPYTKAGRSVVTGMMGKRPKRAIEIGTKLKDNARIGGMFGAPLLVQSQN